MNVLLVQVDGKRDIPNIALQRIAAHHRALGDNVELCRSYHPLLAQSPDLVYASVIFKRNAGRVIEIQDEIKPNGGPHPPFIVGGSGWSISTKIEDYGITTKDQDYSIYPEFRQSIGFTQRGCRLKCSFCIVPRKEGAVQEEHTVHEIWRGGAHPKELLLLDNDFFGQPNWRDRIREIRDGQFKVSFNQGINARFLTDEAAEAIASVDYRDDSMKVKRIYTAWDNRQDRDRLFAGLNRLQKYGVKPDHIMVYMLLGYCHLHKGAASICQCPAADDHAKREERRAELRAFGTRPYPMPYERTPELVGFQRWVVAAYDKRIHWADWKSNNYRPEGLNPPSRNSNTLWE